MPIRSMVLTFALMAIAGPAASLSCMRPDVARTYGYAAEAKETYIVVHGTLKFNDQKLPQDHYNNNPQNLKIKARLSGKSLSQSGFKSDFDRAITLEVNCLGPWCGNATSGVPYLAFLRKEGSAYALAVDPCGGMGFAQPSHKMLRRVHQCMKGGPCTAQTR